MKKIVIVIVVIIVAAVVWYLLSPLFISREVNEDFPVDTNTDIIGEIDEEKLDEMTQEEREEMLETIVEEMSTIEPVVIEDEMPESVDTGPEKLVEGQFMNADDFHLGSGNAGVYELADGSRILRLEDFSVTNGPDLRVVLSVHPAPENSGQLGEFIELGKLKGNKGNQNYDIPTDVDLSKIKSVVIYCKPFRVVFATANIK